MKTIVKYVSETKVELTVNVGPSELEAAEQVALKRLARDIKVAGFRKGHVPLNVAQKHIDPAALQEQTLENALSKAVAEAFMSEKLQALDRPEVEVKKFVPLGVRVYRRSRNYPRSQTGRLQKTKNETASSRSSGC